jgi:hypothetical protein
MFDFLVPAGQTVAASIGSAALMFFGIPLLQKRKKGAVDLLKAVSIACEKAVMAIEQTGGAMDGAEKKRRAEELVLDILTQAGVQAPSSMINAGLEAAVFLMNALVRRKGPPQ